MRLLLVLLLILTLAAQVNFAMTIDEYRGKTPEEKLSILRGKPERILADSSELLRLYAISLADPSNEVRKVAARSSIFLMMGLQEAIPAEKAPSFPEQDSTDLQRALVELLKDEVKTIRGAALNSLAFSAPPTPEIEKLLLSTIKAEKDDEIAGGMIEAMAQAGYDTEQFVSEVTNLLERTTDSRAAYSAGKVLGHLKPESALDSLISLASKPSQAQRHAIQALGAYGKKATKAKSVLDALMRGQAAQEDIRNLARISLEAITTDKPQPSSFQPMKLTKLWPLAVASSSNDALKQVTPIPEPLPAVKPPTPEKPDAKPAPTPSEESLSPTWWPVVVAVLVAALGLLWVWLKKRK